MESACPRTTAASRLDILRGGSGNRALPGDNPGRSAANETSSSGFFAIARRHAVTERLNGSVGASLGPERNLLLDVVIVSSSASGASRHEDSRQSNRTPCSRTGGKSPAPEHSSYRRRTAQHRNGGPRPRSSGSTSSPRL